MNDRQQNLLQILIERLIFIGGELLIDLKPVLAYKKLDLSENLRKELHDLEHQKYNEEFELDDHPENQKLGEECSFRIPSNDKSLSDKMSSVSERSSRKQSEV